MKKRTYEYGDILENLKQGKKATGLEYLQQIKDGALANAPATQTLGMYPHICEYGKAEFEFIPDDYQYNAVGTVHGGVISTLLDSAMGCTLLSTLDADTTFTTLELKVNFLKAITKDTGKLYTDTKIIHAGRTTALLESSLVDKEGKVYAFATSTCIKLPKK